MSDAPLNDWLPIENADFRNWGPWLFHGKAKNRPSHVRVDFGRGSNADTVIYLTEYGSGWGMNYSPTWEDITWYRLRTKHPYYMTARTAEPAQTVQEAAKVLLQPDSKGLRTTVYDACKSRVKVYKFDAVLRAIAGGKDE